MFDNAADVAVALSRQPDITSTTAEQERRGGFECISPLTPKRHKYDKTQ